MSFRHLLLFFILFFSNTIHASPQAPALLTNKINELNLAPHLEILEDPNRQLNIQEIVSPVYTKQFYSNMQTTPNFGRTHSAYWLRFKLENQSDLKWYIRINALSGNDVALFVLTEDGQIITDSVAKYLPDYGLHAWSLTLPKQKNLQFYIRATNGDSIVSIPLELLTADTFLAQTQIENTFFTSIIAAMLMMAGYNLLSFLTLNERSYITLAIHILSMAAVIQIIHPVYNNLNFLRDTDAHFFTTPIYITITTLLIFCRQLLNTHQSLPRLDQLMRWTIFVLMALLFVTGWIPKGTILTQLSILFVFALIFIASIIRSFQGYRIAYYFLLVFMLVTSLIAPDIVINIADETRWQSSKLYSTGIASLLFPLFLSLIQSKTVREWREQKQRAETTNEATKSFLTNISHELRTPMHAVMGINELLKNTPLNPIQADYISRQESASRHMLELVNDLLNLARANKGYHMVELSSKPFCLQDLLHDLDKLFSISAGQKGLILNIPPITTTYPLLLGDEKCLKQVLVNLLSNAIKYTDHGAISLNIDYAISDDKKTMTAHFEVRDTGIGIPVDQQPFLFLPFYRANNQQTQSHSGSGMGLSISYQLLKQMGGELQLNSNPKDGSCFFFTLHFPIYTDKKSIKAFKPSHQKNNLKPLQDIHILLVDDDSLNQFIGKELLVMQGAKVTLADSGKSAIEQIQEQTFDLILMDINMPDMDGYETTRRIRADKQIIYLPIIALTAHALSGECERCLAAGMDDYLPKPFEIKQLTTVIRHWSKRTPNPQRVAK